MYVHLGSDTVVRDCDIIGIFDIENTSVGKITKEYLSASGKRKSACYVSYDMPKSFIVTKDYVYISNVSVFTLKRRFADNEIRTEI